eukprot:TRINITY_DN27289_c0_g1_i1.p1 TRINITY_DN27289_c0_g1~~TRINITY_DN27289_c0_g1_i1.p1  ORF type:complete len:306 (+),score=59.04 TRINITY_DN27289_c0_g1_i1:69-986(+)
MQCEFTMSLTFYQNQSSGINAEYGRKNDPSGSLKPIRCPRHWMQQPSDPPEDLLVYLNVGGHKYVTRYSTLNARGSNFLTQLVKNHLNGPFTTSTDKEDNLFIDRNGFIFGIVLDYLRSGELHVPYGVSRRQVDIEFDYYAVKIGESSSLSPSPNTPVRTSETKDLENIVAEWKEKARYFVDNNGASLMEKLKAQMLEGDNQTVIQFTTKDGMVNIGDVTLFPYKVDHLFLKFISNLMYERYNIRAVWKSTYQMNRYNLQLNLNYELDDVREHDVIQKIKDMVEQCFLLHPQTREPCFRIYNKFK